MFTEGLDENALNWIKEGTENKISDLYLSENVSPNVGHERYIYASLGASGKNWILPPSRSTSLPPLSSGLLSPKISAQFSRETDEDEESVCSAPSQGVYLSSGEEEESLDSEGLQENPLLHSFNNAQRDVYVAKGYFKTLEREPKMGYRNDKRLNDSDFDVNARNEEHKFHSRLHRRRIGPLSVENVDVGKECDRYDETGKECNRYNEPGIHAWTEKKADENYDNLMFQNRVSEIGTPSAPPIVDCETGTQESRNKRPKTIHFMEPEAYEQVEIETENNSPKSSAEQPNINRDENFGNMPSGIRHKRHSIDEQLQTSFKKVCFPNAPAFYVSGNNAWHNFIAYDACVRLCLHAWAGGCMEAPEFLKDECSLLRNAFGLQKILLQPQDEALRIGSNNSSIEESSAPKQKKILGKVKVEVLRVKIMLGMMPGCIYLRPILEPFKPLANYILNSKSALIAGWEEMKTSSRSHLPIQDTATQHQPTCMDTAVQHVKHAIGLIKLGVSTFHRHASFQRSEEKFLCMLQIKSSLEEQFAPLQPELSTWMDPGSGVAHTLLLESLGDTIILEVQDSKGNVCGRVHIKIASITDDMNDRVRWWPIYKEPEHECTGKVQLSFSFFSAPIEALPTKCGPVGETLAYDLVLEAAMRMQAFQPRNLHLHGPWKWLLKEFALYYGVSDSYTKLRYLGCVMEVATPTRDCFELVYELIVPIITARDENHLNRQEKLMLAEIEILLERLLATTFENYKSLDESSLSGFVDVSGSVASGSPATAIVSAVQVYTHLHDILSPEAQTTLRNYFQTAARKRCKRHMAETEEFMNANNDGLLMDPLTVSTAYFKMKSLCWNISNEIQTDIKIHNQHVLPSCIDLPNITGAVYSVELHARLQAFLKACPPSGPTSPVIELLIATSDLQRDLQSWNIRTMKGGVDSKELFNLYIMSWIQDKRHSLLDLCKIDKVRSTEASTQNSTSHFIEDIYERISETLNEYEVIVNRWPEYSMELENALTTVERTSLGSLEKHYAEILSPLKDSMTPKKTARQYMQKLAGRNTPSIYNVPNQLGLFLNTIKRILDLLHPRIEAQLRSWASCLLVPANADKKGAFGEQLNGTTVLLRTKYKAFLQALVEKLLDNTKVQRTTKLKRILKDTKEAGGENDIRERMQPLNAHLIETIRHVHDIFSSHIFVALCRGFWDRMGQEVLSFLENRKENKSWYKGSRFALGILDDTFASEMQRLQGNALTEKDLQPPRSILEARSMLSRDTTVGMDASSFYFL